MIPSANEVAAAIVAAARETGANPVEVLVEPGRLLQVEEIKAIGRARAYAAMALEKVFNRPTVSISKTAIARMVGVAGFSCGGYLHGLHNNPRKWWDVDAFNRVINAIMDVPEGDNETAKADQSERTE